MYPLSDAVNDACDHWCREKGGLEERTEGVESRFSVGFVVSRLALKDVFEVLIETLAAGTAMIMAVITLRKEFASRPETMRELHISFSLTRGSTMEGAVDIFPCNEIESRGRPVGFVDDVFFKEIVLKTVLETSLDGISDVSVVDSNIAFGRG